MTVAAINSVVELRVYDDDASTLRHTVSAASGWAFTDILGEIGQASLSVPLLQAIMQSDPTLLDTRAMLKVATNLTTDPAVLTELPPAYLLEGGEIDLIVDAEDAGKQRVLQCRGVLGLFDDAVLYPENGFETHGADRRAFGWMSKESTHWFDSTQWNGAIHATQWTAVPTTSDRYHKPKGWPDKNAYWVGCGNKEKQYFRTTVTVSDDIPVRIYASADEDLHVYLDSELIIKNNSHEIGYTELNHWRGILTAGTHTIGIKFLRIPGGVHGWLFEGYDLGDVDKMIASVVTMHPDGSVKDVLRRSNNTTHWKCCQRDDGDRPPTWTAAGIIGQLVDEAVARGVQSMSRISFGFTDTHDTDGLGFRDLHERSWPVGTKYSQVLTDLGESDIDWDMLHDLTLNGYRDQGSDVSGTVALTKGVNILSYKAAVTPITATTLMVRAHNRWLTRSDTDSEAVNDRREGFLQTGASLSREHARHIADRALDGMSTERVSYTAEIVAVEGCVPYLDFGKGDVISGYNKSGDRALMRVVSISASGPDDGPIRWTLEMEDPSYATAAADPGAPVAGPTVLSGSTTTVLFDDPLPEGCMVLAAACWISQATSSPSLAMGAETFAGFLGESTVTVGSNAINTGTFVTTALTAGGETSVDVTLPDTVSSAALVFYVIGPKTTTALGESETDLHGLPWSGTNSVSLAQIVAYVPEFVLRLATGYGASGELDITPDIGGGVGLSVPGDANVVRFYYGMSVNTTAGNTDAFAVTTTAGSEAAASQMARMDGRSTT